MENPEKVPYREVEKMAAFAEELRVLGYRGVRVALDAVDLMLAASSSVEQMQAFAECAFVGANPYAALKVGDLVVAGAIQMPAWLMLAYVDDESTPEALVRWQGTDSESSVPWESVQGIQKSNRGG